MVPEDHGQDPCLHPGGLDQRLDEKGELLRLAGQDTGLARLLRRQVPLLQKGGVEENVCNGGLGLVGDVGDQSLDRRPVPLQGLGGDGRAVEEAGQLGLQCGGDGFVKAALPEAAVHCGGEHPVQTADGPAPTVPLIQPKGQAQSSQKEAEPAVTVHQVTSQV